MADVGRHPNVELLAYSEVENVSGYVGNFTVRVRQRARSVDMEKCTGCGSCEEKCPRRVKDEGFNVGLGRRKAIYRPFPQAVPAVPVIAVLFVGAVRSLLVVRISRPALRSACWVLVALVGAAVFNPLTPMREWLDPRVPTMLRSENEENLRYGLFLRDHTQRTTTVGFHWAGTPAFFAQRDGVDVLGKSDPYIARMKVDRFFPGAGHHALEVNYRSPPAVVDAAVHLLGYNNRRIDKRIRSHRADVDPAALTVIQADADTLAKKTAQHIVQWLDDGVSPHEIAVLTRVNSSLIPIKAALVDLEVPSNDLLSAGSLERTAVQALFASVAEEMGVTLMRTAHSPNI